MFRFLTRHLSGKKKSGHKEKGGESEEDRESKDHQEPTGDVLGAMADTSVQAKAPVKQVTCLLIGAGQRGSGYASYGKYFPEEFKIVGVAEPRKFQREREQKTHDIPDSHAFEDWKDAAKLEKFADCVIIGTTDRMHKDPAIAFAKLGYSILLEKPMAVTEEDCREIVSVCQENGVLLVVCHVLRYIRWAQKIKEVIDSGAIGEVVNIQHTEPVGFWHFAHSYVRGNWHREEDSSNSLLAKCCHDVDLIKYWMGSKRCQQVSSFGSLSHFHTKDKPQEAASRCLDCPAKVEAACPYSAKRLYLDFVKSGHSGWPVSVLTDVPDIESVTEALKTGPYGRCVYDMDNDVMSNQVVNFQFEDGAIATLTMVAFTSRLCSRETKVYGTKGEIQCNVVAGEMAVFDFLTQNTTHVNVSNPTVPCLRGHGGADFYLMESFVKAVRENRTDMIKTGAEDTLASHLLVFAAEKARRENRIVTINADGTF